MSLKILHVTSNRDGNIGGAEKLLLDLHERFDSAQFDFHYANVLSLGNSDDPYISALRERKFDFVNFTGVKMSAVFPVFNDLRQFMRQNNFDAVHTHLLHGSFIGQTAARFARIKPKILTRHFTNDVFRGSRFLKALDRRTLKIADKIIAVSGAVKRDVLEQGIAEEKIEVIHNGIDLEIFDEILQNGIQPAENDCFLIGTVGSLTKRKGHEYLLKAFARVIEQIRDIRLIIIGDGPEREKLQQITIDLGLQNYVDFKGFRKDIPQLLSSFDLYVHPAVYEPFGIALTEAMAMQKCVIATDVGGIPEIIVNQETGITVPAADPDKLAEAIIWAYQNTSKVTKMGEAGRRRVEENFDLKNITAKYSKMYLEMINR
jgi:glycosyltransferase involved in cell wall biosynthesis